MIDLDLATPKEQGGPGGATNPEQLLAAGYAGCFHSSLKVVARGENITLIGSEVTVSVGLLKEAGAFSLAVTISADLPGVTREQGEHLLAPAHQRCPYSKATHNNIGVQLVLNHIPRKRMSDVTMQAAHQISPGCGRAPDHGCGNFRRTPPNPRREMVSSSVPLFVNGEGMRGGAVHHTIGVNPFIGYARTAPKYRFFSVDDRFPALWLVDQGGVSVPGELYLVPLTTIRDQFIPAEPRNWN